MEREARNRVMSQLLIEADNVLHDAAAADQDDKTEAEDLRKGTARRRPHDNRLDEKPGMRCSL